MSIYVTSCAGSFPNEQLGCWCDPQDHPVLEMAQEVGDRTGRQQPALSPTVLCTHRTAVPGLSGSAPVRKTEFTPTYCSPSSTPPTPDIIKNASFPGDSPTPGSKFCFLHLQLKSSLPLGNQTTSLQDLKEMRMSV